jgi:hypothetical protein
MMKSELDGMWKEMVMASLRNYLTTHPSWRTTKNLSGLTVYQVRFNCEYKVEVLLFQQTGFIQPPLPRSSAILGLPEVRKPYVNMWNLDPLKSS